MLPSQRQNAIAKARSPTLLSTRLSCPGVGACRHRDRRSGVEHSGRSAESHRADQAPAVAVVAAACYWWLRRASPEDVAPGPVWFEARIRKSYRPLLWSPS